MSRSRAVSVHFDKDASMVVIGADTSWISGADFTVDGGHMASTPKL